MDDLESDLDNSKDAKSQKDDELAELEKEGLDGVDVMAMSDDEDNKAKQEKVVFIIFIFFNSLNDYLKIKEKIVGNKDKKNEITENEKINKNQQKEKKECNDANMEKSFNENENEDNYKIPIEKKYHEIKKFFSAGVLEDEKAVMEEVIQYKKKHNIDYDFFTFKNDLIDGQIQNIQNQIISEVLTIEGYKANISKELNYEKKLLEALNNEKNLKAEEKAIIENRINKRISIINQELEQQAPAEEEEEPEVKEETKEAETSNKEDNNVKETSESENKQQEEKIDLNHNSDNISIQSRKVVEIKDMFLYETLKKRLSEYKLAIEYFEKHDLNDLEKNATNKAREVQKAIIKMEDGKDIDDLNIPESVSPEFICGCSKKERLEKFTTLIKEFQNNKNELITQQNKLLEKFNQMAKKDQQKIVIKFSNLAFFLFSFS